MVQTKFVGQKKVVWPPVPETNGYHQTPQQQNPAPYNNAQQSPASQQQYQAPLQPQYHNQPQYQQPQYQQPQYQQPQYQQPQYQQPQYQQPQHQQQQYRGQSPQPQYQAPQSDPSYCEGRRQEATGLSKLIPVGPGVSAPTNIPYRQGPPSPGIAQPYRPHQSRWAPVPAPLSPQVSAHKETVVFE